jgi:acyl-CoA hydrolase
VEHVSIVSAHCSCEAPEAMTSVLLRERDGSAPVRIFRGMSLAPATVVPDDPRFRVISSGLMGSNRALWQRGQLDVVPEGVSLFPRFLRDGAIGADTVVLRLARDGTSYSSGLVSDYLPAALEMAKRVVAQLTDMPVLPGAPSVPRERIDEFVDGDAAPLELARAQEAPEDAAIGEHVASLVEDGDCLEIGVSGLSTAIARAVAERRRDLSVHTGLINDELLDLIDSGAVTNARKALHPGVSVSPVAMGTHQFYRRLMGRRDVLLRPVDETNDPRTVTQIDNFVAINSAVQADLLGQINSEVVGGRRVSTPGGQLEFFAAARESTGGKAIAVLRSTARGGTVSRIVARFDDGVSTGTTGAVQFVVTEYGVADLRGATLDERARRMVAIAHPDFRRPLLDALANGQHVGS